MSLRFIRIESSDSFGLKTLFGWAADLFGLKLRVHSVWIFFPMSYGFIRFKNFLRMSLGFIQIETSDSFGLKLSSNELRIHSDLFGLKTLFADEPRIHSYWNFGFIRFEVSSTVEPRIHSDSKFGFIRIENLIRNGSEWLALARIRLSRIGFLSEAFVRVYRLEVCKFFSRWYSYAARSMAQGHRKQWIIFRGLIWYLYIL